jgi:hypothetical protein
MDRHGREPRPTPTQTTRAGETRTAPCPPELTALIHEHIAEFGTGPDGRLFVGDRNKKELPGGTVNEMWRRARRAMLVPEVAATPLAETPYDLRHAAASTWLNGGVPPTDVAEWAGQSTEILFRIYAKCLDRGKTLLRRRVDAALGHDPDSQRGHAFGTDTRTQSYARSNYFAMKALVGGHVLAGERRFREGAPGRSRRTSQTMDEHGKRNQLTIEARVPLART